jgi:hypothetical protein
MDANGGGQVVSKEHVGRKVRIIDPHYAHGEECMLLAVWDEDTLPLGWTAGPMGEVRMWGYDGKLERLKPKQSWRSRTGVQVGGRAGWVDVEELELVE